MSQSLLDAIKLGVWDFEPVEVPPREFQPTDALPGTEEKLQILAERVASGLPLWHPEDRLRYDQRLVAGTTELSSRAVEPRVDLPN